MASVSYSFVDIAVLDQVRARFAAGDALLVLAPALDTVIWANGPGAALIGYRNIDEAIGAASGLSMTTRRQISATPGFPRISGERSVATRLGKGLRSPLVTLNASTISLPGGEQAILLAVEARSTKMRDERFRATAAVQGFDEAEQFAALIDENGLVAAASSGFERLGMERDTLRALVAEVRDEQDRLVKRLVKSGARQRPAAIAKLTDRPAWHLLVVVDEQSAPLEHPPVASTQAGSADTGAIRSEETRIHETPAQEPETPENQRHDGEDPIGGSVDGERVAERPETASADRTGDEVTSEAPVTQRPSGTIRFAWRTDAEGRFTALSDAFSEAVGPAAADVLGRRFKDVSNAFGLDPDGRISALLERRDTWSGRTVLWPLQGTDLKVPVDLAALPIYGRERVFEGFHGFGLARLSDAVSDPEGIGLVLTPGAPFPPRGAPEPDLTPGEALPPAGDEHQETADAARGPDEDASGSDPADDTFTTDTAGPEEAQKDAVKIIRLSEHRTLPVSDGALSPIEANAFREIGARLREVEELRNVDTSGTPPPKQHEEDAATGIAEPDGPGTGESETPSQTAESEAAAEAATAGGRTERTDTITPAPEAPSAAAPARAGTFVPSAFFNMPADTSQDNPGLLAGLPLAILIHTGDTLEYANRAFFDLTGYGELEALQTNGGIDALFPESYEGSQTTGEAQALKLRTAQGAERDVRAHLQSVAWREGKALLLALQPVEAVAAMLPQPAPQTENNEETEALHDAEMEAQTAELQMHLAEMRAIVDTATDGVVVIDNDGNIRSTNRPAEALFGFDSEDVTGKPFAALFAIESQAAVREHLNGLSDNGVASVLNDGLEVIGREAQGRFIPLFMTIGRLPHSSGFCAVLRDITQWKRATEELTQARAEAERASSQKTEFLARVSHEVRTPLNAIIGFSELMLDEKFGPIGNDRYRDYLHDINRSGNHVLDLVNDLLDISKIEAGEQEMHYEAVSLNDTLAETVAMMQPQANRERVIIRSSFSSSLPDVVADPRSVRQIALNLLSNAVRYTPAGGQVIVSTAYSAEGSVVMRVRDTGVGMNPAEIEEALKPFKQINSLKRKRGDGTGLGLPLTRAMVEANRAVFAINSVPDEGTLVEISFPPTRVLAD
ncbi:PAS domain S-box protein [Nitratireductor sp. GISD-1A_MAKvit]|uniref:PAS domain S-box protein n=1 Tax=Nitratireductor sp. GISD-1A_MAKvit TaxID=3234198 RepID=UPI00346575DF